MLLAVGLALAVRCFMGLSDRPLMLVGGWEKPRGRCCSTWCFSASTCDLKVFLRPGPQARPHVGPMSGPYPARHESNGGNPCVPETSGDGDSPEPSRAHGSVGPPQPKAVADDRSGSPDGWGSSSGESSKEKQDERISVNSYSDSGVRTPLCRICFQGPEQGELLSPCRCSGSVRCTHEPCLIKWISERGSWSCELCYYKYHVIGISTKNPLQWQAISLTVIEKVQIAAAVLGSLFLVASISWLAWSSVSPQARWQRQDLLFQICYAMYGFMDLVCVVLIIHEGPSVFRIFHRWQAINQRWKVLNYDKARDLEEQQKPGSTPRRHPALPEPNARMGPLSLERLGSGPPSPATSSLLVAVAAAEAGGVTTTLVRVTPIGQVTSRHHREEEEDLGTSPTPTSSVSWSEPGNAGHSLSPVTEQNRSYRWTYSLLHLLGHSRPLAEPHGHEAEGPNPGPAQPRPVDANRELIMRVTTV